MPPHVICILHASQHPPQRLEFLPSAATPAGVSLIGYCVSAQQVNLNFKF